MSSLAVGRVLTPLAAIVAAYPHSMAQGQNASYSTNINALVFFAVGSSQFNPGVASGGFPLLGLATSSSSSSRAPGSSGNDSAISSVDRGLIEHTCSGSGVRTQITNSTLYEGFSFGASGSSSATWNDVVVSYIGGDVGSDVIAVSAVFSVFASATSAGAGVSPFAYNVSASGSIAGTSASVSLAVQNSTQSGNVTIPSVFVNVNQAFSVSMGLNTQRSSTGIAFGGSYATPPGTATWSLNASVATNGTNFGEPAVFNVPEGYTVNSPSMGVVNNRWTGRTVFVPCGRADIGGVGGMPGADSRLDNNDFIVFIDRFFASAPSADVGATGGVAGQDGRFDNNDFIVFIDDFFGGCSN